MEDEVTVFVQFGFCRNLKEGQKLEAFVNGCQLEIEPEDGGIYLTGVAQRYKRLWYLKPITCIKGDIIQIVAKVGIRTLGADERRSFTGLYQVDPELAVEEIHKPVGFGQEYPIVKGPVQEVSFSTLEDERLSKARGILDDNDAV